MVERTKTNKNDDLKNYMKIIMRSTSKVII